MKLIESIKKPGKFEEVDVPDRLDLLTDEIPSNIYKLMIKTDMTGRDWTFLTPLEEQRYIPLEGGKFEKVSNYVEKFFSKDVKDMHKEMSMKYKVGILLHGPPGTGKSALIYLLAKKQVEENDVIVIYVSSFSDASYFMDNYNNKSNKSIIIIYEECDRSFNKEDLDNFNEVISLFLDSPQSPENMCTIATTNHIELIPDALQKRPSRFALVEEINTAPESTVNHFVDTMVTPKIEKLRGTSKKELSLKINEADVTIDEAKTIIQNHIMYGQTIDEAIQSIAELRKIEQ